MLLARRTALTTCADHFAIAIVLVIVAISYRQTIFAYPSGGGAYIVAKKI